MASVIFFPLFIVISNYILLQLVVAAMIELLQDPVKRTVHPNALRTRRSLHTHSQVSSDASAVFFTYDNR
jgi:hypothetical protein